MVEAVMLARNVCLGEQGGDGDLLVGHVHVYSSLLTCAPRMKGGRGSGKLDQSSRRQSSSTSSALFRVARALKSPIMARISAM